ncbi:MAG: hypothetical protein RLZZ74_2649 [Cyanobacteriota bacterium]|jgi:hypothetical protein
MIARARIFTLIGVSVLGLGSTIALSGCTRGGNLSVVNLSATELTNVVATGSGLNQSIGAIPAGQQREVSLRVPGESALKLDFNANGKHFTSGRQGYVEGGYNIKITAIVAPDFTVKVDTNN